jgi:hypothetical protein
MKFFIFDFCTIFSPFKCEKARILPMKTMLEFNIIKYESTLFRILYLGLLPEERPPGAALVAAAQAGQAALVTPATSGVSLAFPAIYFYILIYQLPVWVQNVKKITEQTCNMHFLNLFCLSLT